MIVVERQYVHLDGAGSLGWNFAEFAIDVPTSGSGPLYDSICLFLNKSLYKGFEVDDSSAFPFDQVYTDDMHNLLQNYADKYADQIKQKVEWFSTINIFVIAQTESFLTYGIECYHGSGSTGSEFYCYTFNKKDGHILTNIISWDKLLHFIQDHPDCGHPFEEWQLKPDSGQFIIPMDQLFDVALCTDGLIVINEDLGNHYAMGTIPYKKILPHLSSEAQKLVKNMCKSCNWDDCYLGERLASVKTINNEEYVVMVKPAQHNWADLNDYHESNEYIEEYTLLNNFSYPSNYLKAFLVDSGIYSPANILDGKSVIEGHWDEIITSNPSDERFSFDPSSQSLYIPSLEKVTMGYYECNDRYDVYQWNDIDNFVYKGEDGGFWLHPSIRQFGRLCHVLETDKHLLRIDEMRIYDDRYDDQHEASLVDTCRYRLSMWEANTAMLEKPELVIHDGFIGKDKYVFQNNGYKYVVYLSEGDDCRSLLIYKGSKLISKEDIQLLKSMPL